MIQNFYFLFIFITRSPRAKLCLVQQCNVNKPYNQFSSLNKYIYISFLKPYKLTHPYFNKYFLIKFEIHNFH